LCFTARLRGEWFKRTDISSRDKLCVLRVVAFVRDRHQRRVVCHETYDDSIKCDVGHTTRTGEAGRGLRNLPAKRYP